MSSRDRRNAEAEQVCIGNKRLAEQGGSLGLTLWRGCKPTGLFPQEDSTLVGSQQARGSLDTKRVCGLG